MQENQVVLLALYLLYHLNEHFHSIVEKVLRKCSFFPELKISLSYTRNVHYTHCITLHCEGKCHVRRAGSG